MVEQLIIFFLLHWGVMVIVYKYQLDEKLQMYALVKGNRFLHDLADCAFCFEFWFGVLILLCIVLVGMPYFVLMPFLSTSLMNIIKSL